MADGLFTNILKAVSPGRKAVAPTVTAGKGGATAYGGYLVERERSPSIAGKAKYRTYSDILANTSIVAAGTRYFLNILGKSSWSVEPATDSQGKELNGAKEVADFIESCMCDMTTPWSKVIRRAAMFRYFGFSIQEWTAKRRDVDGKLGMLDVEARPQSTIERWDLDDNGSVLGCWQLPELAAGEIYLPRKKIIHLVDDSLNDSPEGLGILRHLVKTVERLTAYEELEQVGYETDLRGIPIARAPLTQLREMERQGKLTAPEATKLLGPLTRFLGNHIRNEKSGLLMDSATFITTDDKQAPSNEKMWDVSLLQGDASGQGEVANAINRLNRELATVLGTDHLLLGSDGTGSLALGTMKVTDFYMTVTSCQNDIRDAYNRDFVGALCTLNGIPKELWPKLKTEDVQFKDVAMMATTLKDMAAAGAVLPPDDPAIGEMRDLLGLSRTPQEMLDREMENAALKTGAELEALTAKAQAAMGKPPADDKSKGKGKDVKSGEAGAK
jgi:hypothetical protein